MGLYAVVSYAASRRVHEIGVRMALGARPRDVRRLVVRGGLRLALIGLAVGLLLPSGPAWPSPTSCTESNAWRRTCSRPWPS